jgi:hypothetical protein
MPLHGKALDILSVAVFSAGALLGLVLAAATVWADFEAALFDVSIRPDERLTTLSCPPLMTTAETATVSASFTNTAEWPVRLTVMARISDGFVTLIREERALLPLEPGEARRLEWEVTPGDRVYDRFVLVRVHSLRYSPHPYRQGSCGIVVLDTARLGGSELFALGVGASLLAMGLGLGLWIVSRRPLLGRARGTAYIMGILAAIVLVAIAAGALGWWGVGAVALVVTALFLVVILGRFAG